MDRIGRLCLLLGVVLVVPTTPPASASPMEIELRAEVSERCAVSEPAALRDGRSVRVSVMCNAEGFDLRVENLPQGVVLTAVDTRLGVGTASLVADGARIAMRRPGQEVFDLRLSAPLPDGTRLALSLLPR